MPIIAPIWQLSKRIYPGMAACVMNRISLCAFIAGATLILGGCGGTSSPTEQSAGQQVVSLVGARIGGPFTLTDQSGTKRKWEDFRGQYRIVYFGYTNCPDVCPVDLQRIMQGLTLFEKNAPARAARVQPMFITVDPQRDSPAVLKAYVSALHPRLMGLTGTPDEIAAVAKAFAVVYSHEKPNATGAYIVGHSRTPYLFGPDGKPLALVPTDDPDTPAQEGTPHDVEALLDSLVK
jgi:protein SCO1/2